VFRKDSRKSYILATSKLLVEYSRYRQFMIENNSISVVSTDLGMISG